MGFSEQIDVSNVLLLPSGARTASLEAAAMLNTRAVLKCMYECGMCMLVHESVPGKPKSKFLCSTVHVPTAHKKTAHQ